MKFSEVPIGSYILIPCPRCGEKKRLKITKKGPSEFAKMKSQICQSCRSDDKAEGQYLINSPRWTKQPQIKGD